MSDYIFDVDNWEAMYKLSKDMAVGARGQLLVRMGDNYAMEMDTGEMHFTTPWEPEDPNSVF